MIKLYYGGVSCGKKEIAISCALKENRENGAPITYIITTNPYGEAGEKYAKKRKKELESKNFRVLSQYFDIGNASVRSGTVIVECVGNLLANAMFHQKINRAHICEYIIIGIKQLADKCDNLIIVSSDLSDGADNPSRETIEYINNLETVNKGISAFANEIYCVRVGIPILKK